MRNFKFIIAVLLGGTLYGTMSSFVKLSYNDGFTAGEISFWQAFLAAVILTIIAVTSRSWHKVKPRTAVMLLLTGTCIGMTNYLYYKSVGYIPASIAIIVLMQCTVFCMVIELLVFRCRPSVQEVIALYSSS